MIVVTLGNKGGIGKTNLALNIATIGLSEHLSVLLCDGDPQGTILTWHQLALSCGSVPTVIRVDATLHHPSQLPRIGQSFDLIVIDCPQAPERLTDDGKPITVTEAALEIADLVLLPCTPADIWKLKPSIELVQSLNERRVRGRRSQLKAAVVVTMKHRNTLIGQRVDAELTGCPFPVLSPHITFRISHQEARIRGQSVITYKPRDQIALSEMQALFESVCAYMEDSADGDSAEAKTENSAKQLREGSTIITTNPRNARTSSKPKPTKRKPNSPRPKPKRTDLSPKNTAANHKLAERTEEAKRARADHKV